MGTSAKWAGSSFLYGKHIDWNMRLMFHHQTMKNPVVARWAGAQSDAGVSGEKVAAHRVANVAEPLVATLST